MNQVFFVAATDLQTEALRVDSSFNITNTYLEYKYHLSQSSKKQKWSRASHELLNIYNVFLNTLTINIKITFLQPHL